MYLMYLEGSWASMSIACCPIYLRSEQLINLLLYTLINMRHPPVTDSFVKAFLSRSYLYPLSSTMPLQKPWTRNTNITLRSHRLCLLCKFHTVHSCSSVVLIARDPIKCSGCLLGLEFGPYFLKCRIIRWKGREHVFAGIVIDLAIIE